jgi:hypothetical protein
MRYLTRHLGFQELDGHDQRPDGRAQIPPQAAIASSVARSSRSASACRSAGGIASGCGSGCAFIPSSPSSGNLTVLFLFSKVKGWSRGPHGAPIII